MTRPPGLHAISAPRDGFATCPERIVTSSRLQKLTRTALPIPRPCQAPDLWGKISTAQSFSNDPSNASNHCPSHTFRIVPEQDDARPCGQGVQESNNWYSAIWRVSCTRGRGSHVHPESRQRRHGILPECSLPLCTLDSLLLSLQHGQLR